MKVNVLELREGENFQEFLETPVSLDLGSLSSAFKADIPVKLRVYKHENEIIVWGNASAEVTEECSRCLASFDRKFVVQFEVFSDKMGSQKRKEEDRAAEGETFSVPHDGKILDLGPCVREAILLSLPIKPLCEEDCRGLCPLCGKDLNDGPCDCQKAETDARWSVLERLKKEKEK